MHYISETTESWYWYLCDQFLLNASSWNMIFEEENLNHIEVHAHFSLFISFFFFEEKEVIRTDGSSVPQGAFARPRCCHLRQSDSFSARFWHKLRRSSFPCTARIPFTSPHEKGSSIPRYIYNEDPFHSSVHSTHNLMIIVRINRMFCIYILWLFFYLGYM